MAMAKIIDLGKDGDFKPSEEFVAAPGEWAHYEGEYRAPGSDEWKPATLSILWDAEGKGFEEISID